MDGGKYNIDAKGRVISKASIECGMVGRMRKVSGCFGGEFKVKACKRCGEVFKPKSAIHKYCGSWLTKNTCAYIVYYMSRRVRHYGVTIEYIEELYEKQLGLCAICDKSMSYGEYQIDHSHVTGKVRGLLCRGCNMSLGHVEKEDWLNKVLKYLKMDKIRMEKRVLKVI